MGADSILVFVNGKAKHLYLGLRVRHAIGPRSSKAVEQHRAVVRDVHGSTIDIDGAVHDGERLFVVQVDPKA